MDVKLTTYNLYNIEKHDKAENSRSLTGTWQNWDSFSLVLCSKGCSNQSKIKNLVWDKVAFQHRTINTIMIITLKKKAQRQRRIRRTTKPEGHGHVCWIC